MDKICKTGFYILKQVTEEGDLKTQASLVSRQKFPGWKKKYMLVVAPADGHRPKSKVGAGGWAAIKFILVGPK